VDEEGCFINNDTGINADGDDSDQAAES